MSTKRICINAMGIALFAAFTLCLQVPVFENYYLCLGYVAMAVYTYHFGTLSGTLTGTAGVLVYCLISSGIRGMPGWMLGNAVIGVLCGIAAGRARQMKSRAARQALMAAAAVASSFIGILLVKSAVEVVLYALPFALRMASNVYAFAADALVLALGFWLSITGEGVLKSALEVNR